MALCLNTFRFSPLFLLLMKILLFTLLLLTSFLSGAYAQQIVVKKGVIFLDNQPYARMAADGDKCFYISNLKKERLFVVNRLSLNDPIAAEPTNPTGEVRYWQFVFTKSKTVVETPFQRTYGETERIIARKICLAQLLKNDELDPQALADFVTNNGALFTERRRALNNPPLLLPAN
jgi:hypothetical protein